MSAAIPEEEELTNLGTDTGQPRLGRATPKGDTPINQIDASEKSHIWSRGHRCERGEEHSFRK